MGSFSLAPPAEIRACYISTEERGPCILLAPNTTQQECCCTDGHSWGITCQANPCPEPGTAEFQTLCPSGRGYVTTGPADQSAFSYRDVDECKLFDSEVCKNGKCVNNIPGYSCYCSSGYYYHTGILECVDNDECVGEEDPCPGSICVNTVGSYHCTCEPPLVLDDTQTICVNSTGLAVDVNQALCWQHVTTELVCQSPLLDYQVTFTECCCLYGEAWGLQCALCPPRDSDEFESLCNAMPPPSFPDSYPETYGPRPIPRPAPIPGSRLPYGPYGPEPYPDPARRRPDYGPPDYDDYGGLGGRRGGLRERRPGSYGPPDTPYTRTGPGRYYDEGGFDPRYASPEGAPRIPFGFGVGSPRSEGEFGVRVPDGLPLSLAPLPENSPYREEEGEEDEEEDDSWRPGPPFPPYGGRRGPAEPPRRVYERRYESYEGLSADECGIVHGCENGRCIRITEGYTCDCYDGYQLDMTTMACIDINECDEPDTPDCVNGQCVNTEGSYRCECLRGFSMSHQPNVCVPA